MKKILSVLLVCIMLFSSVSIIACADTVQYYRNGLFEFYLEDKRFSYNLEVFLFLFLGETFLITAIQQIK